MWVYGGMVYDTLTNHLPAYSMKDATDWERTSVGQTLKAFRKKWFVVGKKMTPEQIVGSGIGSPWRAALAFTCGLSLVSAPLEDPTQG